MNRREFLGVMSSLAAASGLTVQGATEEVNVQSRSNRLPRKVIVGTAMQAFWGTYPGLAGRLGELAGMVDKWPPRPNQVGRGLDLAVLPETSITGEADVDALKSSVSWEGPVQDVFCSKSARASLLCRRARLPVGIAREEALLQCGGPGRA